ncbi:15751_t:CDS:2, partial [Dentiscutata erythropus]
VERLEERLEEDLPEERLRLRPPRGIFEITDKTPKDQISRIAKMLADEYGTASNIKSRVNRLSVLAAITSTQQRLKLYTK